MEINYINILYWCLLFTIFFIIIIILYAYNSGSCKLNKNYICNGDFCLYKEFEINLSESIKDEINKMLNLTQIQKRVDIEMYPEIIFNCALPNKKGITISTQNVSKYAPELINFYQNNLCKFISNKINLDLFPTDINLPTTCAILIYENEGDWINWHYDYNYYDGRFFTLLIPITNNLTCTKFQFKTNNDEIKTINLINNNSVLFEGNYLYHMASKLCKDQKRILLSCQYVTNNNISILNKIRLGLKDFAYTGKINI